MKSERFKRIEEENIRFERESPYNFCDRWCERCPHEKQTRCRLYQDEFEQKITCIAHGRDPNDPEITEEVLKWQFEGVDEKIQQFCEENDIDLDEIDESEFEEMQWRRETLKKHPLNLLGKQYLKVAHKFLEETFYDKKDIAPKLIPHFETVAWYHTLLSVKLHRALDGFYEPPGENEFSLCDAVAQFAICKKSINESIKALQILAPNYPATQPSPCMQRLGQNTLLTMRGGVNPKHKTQIIILSTLLRNILKGIEKLEEGI